VAPCAGPLALANAATVAAIAAARVAAAIDATAAAAKTRPGSAAATKTRGRCAADDSVPAAALRGAIDRYARQVAALPDALRGRVDVLVANAPYVPSDEIAMMPTEARDHEHRVALDGGPDGLDVQRRIIAAAPDWLSARGALIIETSRRQAPATAAAMAAAGLSATVVIDDSLAATAVVGVRAAQRRRPAAWETGRGR